MSKKMDVAVYQQPKDGNLHCGDSYFYQETEHGFMCVIADGLGSGEYARESSQIVVHTIQQNSNITLEDFVERCNQQLIGKRGVVCGILKVNFLENRYTYTSIGNIGMLITLDGEKKKRMVPSSGFLAGYKRPLKVTEGELLPNMQFIMFSDGVKEEELAENYFLNENVHAVTGTYRERMNGNTKDDTTLIAMRFKGN